MALARRLSMLHVRPITSARQRTVGPSLSYLRQVGSRPAYLGWARALSTSYRNVAIVAHVDHGKTTLVDALLRQSMGDEIKLNERTMDTFDQERERGITILSKITSLEHGSCVLNIVDTPGHADFGGEVERVLSMVDGFCLVVDASEGVMTQTKFVLRKVGKALSAGLQPLVVINKVDRPTARTHEVESEILDLMIDLDANDEQLEYPVLLASGKEGWACKNDGRLQATEGMTDLLDAIVEHCPSPRFDDTEAPFSMLVSITETDASLHLSTKMLLTGLVVSGNARIGDVVKALPSTQALALAEERGEEIVAEEGRIAKIFSRRGVARREIDTASAGNIVTLCGLKTPRVGYTIAAPSVMVSLAAPSVDPPTLAMSFFVNDSPEAGKSGGTKLTSALIKEWLLAEAASNVCIEVNESFAAGAMEVRGRGEMQLGVLIETMRRDGFELSVSPPRVLLRWEPESNAWLEPQEEVVVDVDAEFGGSVIEEMAARAGLLQSLENDAMRQRLIFVAPSRGLVGLRAFLQRATRGDAIVNTVFNGHAPIRKDLSRVRKQGVMVSTSEGVCTAYSLAGCQTRGQLFVKPGDTTYSGMIIGEHSRATDLEMNPTKGKELTNMRASGKDDTVRLTPPRKFMLEDAIGYVQPGELIEVTPESVRMRKSDLDAKVRENNLKHAKRNKTAGLIIPPPPRDSSRVHVSPA